MEPVRHWARRITCPAAMKPAQRIASWLTSSTPRNTPASSQFSVPRSAASEQRNAQRTALQSRCKTIAYGASNPRQRRGQPRAAPDDCPAAQHRRWALLRQQRQFAGNARDGRFGLTPSSCQCCLPGVDCGRDRALMGLMGWADKKLGDCIPTDRRGRMELPNEARGFGAPATLAAAYNQRTPQRAGRGGAIGRKGGSKARVRTRTAKWLTWGFVAAVRGGPAAIIRARDHPCSIGMTARLLHSRQSNAKGCRSTAGRPSRRYGNLLVTLTGLGLKSVDCFGCGHLKKKARFDSRNSTQRGMNVLLTTPGGNHHRWSAMG